MRISLLQQREPFEAIFGRTMARFLHERYGAPFTVRWHNEPGMILALRRKSQAWFVNIYLNAIFPAQAEAALFEPLRREFSRSQVGWRRPIQQIYVKAASSPLTNRFFAQAWLEITPTVKGIENWLIVPGNHKIRILDRQAGTVTSILKDGFDAAFFQSELETRRAAEAAGVMVPPLSRVEASSSWFEEQYVLGTPLNRLPDAAEADRALHRVYSSLQPFYETSHQEQPVSVYVCGLASYAKILVEQNHLLDASHKQNLYTLIDRCEQHLQPWNNEPILLSSCHGDFQPANLLADGERTWLIDWEYARCCQAGYDALVYGLGARHPRGLADRVRDFVAGAAASTLDVEGSSAHAADWSSRPQRLRAAWIFLLEELVLHLHENANLQFYRLGDGLVALEQEFAKYLSVREAARD